MSTSDLILAMLLILAGSFVQSSIGFGLAIVSAPLLFMLSPDFVPAPITLTAFVISLFNTWKHRANISMRGLWYAFSGRIPGSLVGGWILWSVDTTQLGLWLGAIVIFGVLASLLPVRIQPNPRRWAIAGFFSGVFGTTSSIGGPPMALLLQHQKANSIRANLSAFFLFSSLLSLMIQIPVGYMGWHHLQLTLPLIPAALLGYVLAARYANSIPKQHIRAISLLVCAFAGLTAVVTALF